ncbi:MAG TPA: hypothetical protein VGS01_09495 [Candidatus Limnocylindria bacterium]|jgi:hypothetical protein|nr:hypothetical protein [Candidatus Limnocylindria bacterium]
MTTGADLITEVRRSLRDWPRLRVDTGTGDGASDFFDLGKDVSVQQNSEIVSVAGIPKVRGVDYTVDYDANQVLFSAAAIPGNGVAIKARYKEQVWRDELVIDGLNAGRRMLFPRFYRRDSATITIRNNVRDYQLDGADVNEANMRAVFAQGEGSFKVLRAMVQPLGSAVDQLGLPFRKFWHEWRGGHPFIHCWRILGQGDQLRLDVMYAFSPIVDATTVVDVPDRLQELVTLWACSTLSLKTEPQRGRLDTANVQQANFANPPGTMAQTAEDFQKKFWDMFKSINSEPPTIEVRDMPLPWEAGYRGYI